MKSVFFAVTALLAAPAFADTYKIDTTASKVEWKAGKKVGSFHEGTIQIGGGELQTDKKGKINAGNVVIDMKTLSNTDLKDSPDMQKKLVGHLSSDDFFKVGSFPESTFKMTSIAPKAGSKDEYVVKGDLTIIGTTKPIQFPAKIVKGSNLLTGTAKLTIERLNWGLQYGSGSIFKTLTADKIINDTFDLTLNLVAKK
jgi:polyisoprenoid-binding protein YceI